MNDFDLKGFQEATFRDMNMGNTRVSEKAMPQQRLSDASFNLGFTTATGANATNPVSPTEEQAQVIQFNRGKQRLKT